MDMYRIKDYTFTSFKVIPGLHKSNYAVITNKKSLGIKYCPTSGFEGEYRILRKLNHKQIPKAYEHGEDILFKNDKSILPQYFIVLDHAMDMALIRYFKEKGAPMSPEQLRTKLECFISVCDPLDYLHTKGYLHCDIKPGHFMYAPKTNMIYLIDFELTIKKGGIVKGFSKDYSSPEYIELIETLQNAPDYAPLAKIASKFGLDERTDIYSLGTVIYELITEKKWSETKESAMSFNKFVSPQLDKILMATLEENRENRIPSIKELWHELKKVI